jgi:hypothetical protein
MADTSEATVSVALKGLPDPAATANALKSGWKTSEFWLTLVSLFCLFLPGIVATGQSIPWLAALLTVAGTVLTVAYVWGRALLKGELAKQTNVIPDAWEPTLSEWLDMAERIGSALSRVRPPAAGESAPTLLAPGTVVGPGLDDSQHVAVAPGGASAATTVTLGAGSQTVP